MGTGRLVRSLGIAAVSLALWPALASAQSAIAGAVKDTSGALLPGVTVEASSPVLIEKVRAVQTDGQGRYTIVDLRPGVYTVSFVLPGFSTVRREGLEVQSNITLPLNVELRVGALEETVTVTGASPVVDVQSTTRTQVVSRELMDSIPNARNLQSIASMVPGIKLNAPDVGGSQQMEQTYLATHGNSSRNTTVQVDGMMINGVMNDGQIQAYTDNALVQEATYQTSGVSAEVSAGGVRLNMIPKEGGNTFKGSGFFGGSNGDWQSDNVSSDLIAKGFTGATKIVHIEDFNLSGGGPIKKDKVWFFASGRYQSTNDQIANAFYSDGRPGVQDQYIKSISLRVTWQMSPKNKLSAYDDRIFKFKGHEITALQDVGTASLRRDPVLYYVGQAKFTSTITNKLLLETGYSTNVENYTDFYQPGITKVRGTPEWFANASRFDRTLGTRKTAGSINIGQYPERFVLSTSTSYVTGSHAFKTGVQWTFGSFLQTRDANADLVQEYQSGVPVSVSVYNTPTRSVPYLDGDTGIYGQDTWSFKRVTLNLGLRFDYLRGSIGVQDAGPGRFAPPRHYDPINCKTLPGMTCWSSFSPRLGMTYDPFGTSKTAIKASFGRYVQPETTGFISTYNPMFQTSERRTWKDTNADDIAQDSEIGPSPNASFGTLAGRRPDPNYQREFNYQYSVGIQRELAQNISLTAAWYRRTAGNIPYADNQAYSLSDWTPVQVISPLNGEVITAYNLNKAKFGLPQDIVDFNSKDSNTRRNVYTGFEVSTSARLPRRANVFAGWSADRTIDVNCNNPDDPNTLRFCDQSVLGVPFRHEFKLSGNVPLWYGFEVSGSLISYAGATVVSATNPSTALQNNWNITPTTKYADGTLVIPNMTNPSLTVWLIAPNTQFLPRWNQLDFGIKRIFRFSNGRDLQVQTDIFNALNSNVVLNTNQTFGATYGQPLTILTPRLFRIAAQVKF
jgi:Carboxypeptidase regulatory-like domain